MADSKELKPKSFRVTEETAEKFKEISAVIGGNQQETLAKLIEAYEFQAGKAVLAEKRETIEQFEAYVNALTRMYMGSLEDNKHMSETVHATFEAQLKSKDDLIQDLQSQLTVAKQLKEESTSRAKTYAEENDRLNGVIESLKNEYDSKSDDLMAMLTDKDKLNQTLTDSNKELKEKADKLQRECENLTQALTETDNLKARCGELEKENSDFRKEIDQLKQHEVDELKQQKEEFKIQLQQKQLDIDRTHHEEIQKIKEQHIAEIDKYQKKYQKLLDQMNGN